MKITHGCMKRATIVAGTLLALAAAPASAATNLSSTLKGFTGNSTQGATQAALAAAGLNATSTAGSSEDPPGSGNFVDPTIDFDATGAHYGNLFLGDGGRNYIRTVQTDYANVSFVAEVTWTTIDTFSQASYFGLGSAEYGSFRIADWGTPFSAVQLFIESDPVDPRVFTLKNDNGVALFDAGTTATGLDAGTHRLRLSYDWFQKSATFSIDVNYAGGAFTADVTSPAVGTIGLYGSDGWPHESARLYFGGDDGTTYTDFQVTVSTPNMRLGDLNQDGNLTSADWTILRNNQLANLTGSTLSQAYFLGDLTTDLANNHADFVLFKDLYDAANGVGSFAAMAASVPEPSTIALVALGGVLVRRLARRTARRGRFSMPFSN